MPIIRPVRRARSFAAVALAIGSAFAVRAEAGVATGGCTAVKPGANTYPQCSYVATGPGTFRAFVLGSALYDIAIDGRTAISGTGSADGAIPSAAGQTVTIYIGCNSENDGYCVAPGVAAVSAADDR
jgi:hypothetical protein